MRLRGISWSLLRGPMRAIGPRPDGSRTGGDVKTLASEKLFVRGQEDEVSVMAWRSFKLPRKIAGSNNGETQALASADESLWLARLAWSEMHGAPMRRWHLDEAVRKVGGMLITDPGEEARGIKEQCAVSNARIHWVKHFHDVGRQFDQTWIARSCCDGIVLGRETMELHL